ncbi:fluoroacetyl-CoA thioesterase [Streptomyces umbrinus]|uniref:Fluoroacetyl-CoA thioesterase n=1 Tax=Streptomyces umbrinus TaxID=67370 RepID=A0ABU0T106_9ACTN|nr:fluoroacetyl-CoA thioesterase [Streptomyces umbrinus]MDQ1029493.1 fluoroacetyl-CoA thioesterase [Streptomyces umbrinus]
MKDGLLIGDTFTHHYQVPPDKTVRHIYQESPEFSTFPEVFATGFMVGLMEWACVRAMQPYLGEGEGSVGTSICVTHSAATPPGLTVSVAVELLASEGRRTKWQVTAHDGVHEIGAGTHERSLIDLQRFNAGVEKKLRQSFAEASTDPVN